MKWCCGGLDHDAGGSSTTAPILPPPAPVNGGSNSRRQQLTIQGDQVVLDATTINLNHHAHFATDEHPSTSQEAYQGLSAKKNDSANEPLLEGSPRHSSLIMDKYGPMLLKPCKIVSTFQNLREHHQLVFSLVIEQLPGQANVEHCIVN